MISGATAASVLIIGGAMLAQKRKLERRRGQLESKVEQFEVIYESVMRMPLGLISDRFTGAILQELMRIADELASESDDLSMIEYASRVEPLIGAWMSQYLAFIHRPMPIHEHMDKEALDTILYWLKTTEKLLSKTAPSTLDQTSRDAFRAELEQARWKALAAFNEVNGSSVKQEWLLPMQANT